MKHVLKQWKTGKLLKLLLVTSIITSTALSLSSELTHAQPIDPIGQQLVLWHPHSAEREAALVALVEDFNAGNEWEIEVQPVSMGNAGGVYEQVIVQLSNVAEPQLPNLVIVWPYEAALFELSGRIVDLNHYVNDEEWGLSKQAQSDFLPVVEAWGTNPLTGAQIGWPVRAFTMMMVVNMDALDELGYSEVPSSLTELAEMACAYQENGGWSAVENPVAWGFRIPNDAAFLAGMASAQGEGIFSRDESSGYQLNTNAMQLVMMTMRELLAQGCAGTRETVFDDLDDFVAGKTLFYFGSSSNLSALRNGIGTQFAIPFDWQVHPLPGNAEVGIAFGPVMSMIEHNPSADLAAWLFLQWFTSAEVNAEWARATISLPLRESARDFMVDDFIDFPQWGAAWQLLYQADETLPTVAGYDVVAAEMAFAFRRVLLAVTSPEAELPILQEVSQTILQSFAPEVVPESGSSVDG
jgi:ABC-type glycerol-3-phosphate transport system substrate-binding protein